MEGSGTVTTVNGDACEMAEGDLILTPPWHWHDHQNHADTPMVWFDGLDLPLIKQLDAIFFQEYPDSEFQPVLGANISEKTFGSASVVPSDAFGRQAAYSPLLVYRFEDAEHRLASLISEAEESVASVTYVNPLNGSNALPTMRCQMHRIAAGAQSHARRVVGSSVFVVFRGQGSSIINGTSFAWNQGDIFVVPSWAAFEHGARVDSHLFSIDDSPVMSALGLYKEMQMDEPQVVHDAFVSDMT
jgi:gentisate 1,2-dioxygenase